MNIKDYSLKVGEAMYVRGQEVHGNSVFFLNFAVNLKLLFEKKSLLEIIQVGMK